MHSNALMRLRTGLRRIMSLATWPARFALSLILSIAKGVRTGLNQVFFLERREVGTPITKLGIEVTKIRSSGFAGGVLATDFPDDQRPPEFTRSTAIINGASLPEGAFGIWTLPIDNFVRSNLVDMTLKIETVRTHGMLHTPPYDLDLEFDGKRFRRSARIFVNEVLLDEIHLVRQHPHGEDFGVDSRRPMPILRYLLANRTEQLVRIELDENVAWDIDRVTIEPIVRGQHLRTWASMVLGALVSSFVGALNDLVALLM